MTRTARLWTVLVANLGLVAALAVAGIAARSLGVWAEGADDLADVAAIGVSLLAIHLATRPATVRRPGGYPRATRLAALANAGWLLALSLLVGAGAVERLAKGAPAVHGLAVLVVSGAAALVMLGGALVLCGDAGGQHDDEGAALNLRAVLLDTAGDAAAAGGVAVTGAVIYATGGNDWLDPAVALAVAVVVAFRAGRLVTRVLAALRA